MSLWNKQPAAARPYDDCGPLALTPDALRALPGLRAVFAAPAVLVAVSGGPDSMALCALLSRLHAAGQGPFVHTVTVDHALRPESATEAAQVGQWLAGWPGVSHQVLTRTAVTPGRTMERARHDRYALLAEYARSHRLAHILTAHHRDDQAETFLMRLAAGSGLDGLAAMPLIAPHDSGLSLVRPLLPWGKDALIAYCNEHALPYVTDPSNSNDAYARPRLRAALAHLGAEGLSAARLAITAHRLQSAREALEHYAQASFETTRIAQSDGYLAFDQAKLATEPRETRRRVLLLAVQALRPDSAYGPRRGRLEDLEAALFADAPFRRATLGGVLFTRDDKNGRIVISRE